MNTYCKTFIEYITKQVLVNRVFEVTPTLKFSYVNQNIFRSNLYWDPSWFIMLASSVNECVSHQFIDIISTIHLVKVVETMYVCRVCTCILLILSWPWEKTHDRYFTAYRRYFTASTAILYFRWLQNTCKHLQQMFFRGLTICIILSICQTMILTLSVRTETIAVSSTMMFSFIINPCEDRTMIKTMIRQDYRVFSATANIIFLS